MKMRSSPNLSSPTVAPSSLNPPMPVLGPTVQQHDPLPLISSSPAVLAAEPGSIASASVAPIVPLVTGSPPHANYRISTPQGLYLGMIGLSTTTLLFTGLLLTGIRHQQQTVQNLSQSFVPSLAATQRIEESLAALDTNLVQILLAENLQADATESLQADAKQAFEEHRQKIANDLLQLNQGAGQINSPISREEQRQTTLLQVEFGSYLMAAEQAQILRASDLGASPLAAYETALTQLESRLLPAAIALRQAQHGSFTAVYEPSLLRLQNIQRQLLLLSILQFLSLALLQLFLSYRTRRILNPALLLASVLTLQFSFQALQGLYRAEQQLQQATAIAIQTLQTFAEDRSHAYLTHSHIGQSLLNASSSVQSDLEELRKQLFSIPYLDPTAHMDQAWENTVTESVSSQAMLQALNHYQAIAKKVLVLNLQKKQPQQAIILATGYRTGELNSAFEAFKEQQQNVVNVYQAALDQAISQSLEASEHLERRTPVLIAIFFMLVALGMYPRLREYMR